MPALKCPEALQASARHVRAILEWKGVVRVTGYGTCMHHAADLIALTVHENPSLSKKCEVRLQGAESPSHVAEELYSVLQAVPQLTTLLFDSEYGARYDETGKRVDVVVRQDAKDEERWIGMVKAFSYNLGFGFIDVDPCYRRYNGEVFVSSKQIDNFEEGDEVSFNVRLKTRGHPEASDLQGLTRSG